MKKFILFCVVLALLWFAWDKYYREPEMVTTTRTVVQRVVTQEKYGESLRAVTDSLFSPLDGRAPNPKAEIAKLAGMAQSDARNGLISEREADLVIRLCRLLERVHEEREQYAAGYRDIQNKRYSSFQGSTGVNNTKRFFLERHHRNWESFVNHHRPIILRGLEELRSAEREREHGK